VTLHRLLRELAGVLPGREERRQQRIIARGKRYRSEQDELVVLIDKVRQREQGVLGARPMPYAKKLEGE